MADLEPRCRCAAKNIARKKATVLLAAAVSYYILNVRMRQASQPEFAAGCGVQGRQALRLSPANPQAIESARDLMAREARSDVMLCPSCMVHNIEMLAKTKLGHQRDK